MKKLLTLICVVFCSILLPAQTVNLIGIETKNTSLVFTVDNHQKLLQSYLGEKLAQKDYSTLHGGREAYLTAGMENQFDPAIRMVHADGNPSLELQYVSYKTEKKDDITNMDVLLKDPAYPVEVTLHYTAYYDEDVIKSWTEIKHHEKKPVLLTQYASSQLHFNADEYWLTQFHGDWAREMNMVEEKLTNGINC